MKTRHYLYTGGCSPSLKLFIIPRDSTLLAFLNAITHNHWMGEWLDILLSLVTLTILEVVLGIDNLVFLAIIAQRLPEHLQAKARKVGLTLAWVTRILLLAFAVWLTKLTQPLLHVMDLALSGRDIFLFLGGLFLLVKATQEIHAEFEPHEIERANMVRRKKISFSWIVTQIAVLDIVFFLGMWGPRRLF